MQHIGTPTTLPEGLTRARTLEEYDGPLLVEFLDPQGTSWVYKWADKGEDAHRWVLFRTTAEGVQAYLDGKVPLYRLMLDAGPPWLLVDINVDQDPIHRGVWQVDTLPDSYLPTQDGYHLEDLRGF